MHSSKRLKVTEVNPFLICVLCGGYYIDATTIIECLHSFCRSCIVKYLEKNKYCPICDVQIHKTDPLLNIRSDKTLQNIVYKLVPNLYQNEMRRRFEFYQDVKDAPLDPEARGLVTENSPIILPNELISVGLQYIGPRSKTVQTPIAQNMSAMRYLNCPAAVTIAHLQKLISGKFDLNPLTHAIQIFYQDNLLLEDMSLMDVAYAYLWQRKAMLHLTYRILEVRRKKVLIRPVPVQNKNDHDKNDGKDVPQEDSKTKGGSQETSEKEMKVVNAGSEESWKGVQLRISENGVMSVTCEGNFDKTVKESAPGGIINDSVETKETVTSEKTLSGGEAGKFEIELNPPISTPAVVSSSGLTSTTSVAAITVTSNSTTPTTTTTLSSSNVQVTIEPQPLSKPPELKPLEPVVSVSKVSKEEAVGASSLKKSNTENNRISISRVQAKGDALNKIVSRLSPNERLIGNTSVTIRPVPANSPKPDSPKASGSLSPQVSKTHNSVSIFREPSPPRPNKDSGPVNSTMKIPKDVPHKHQNNYVHSAPKESSKRPSLPQQPQPPAHQQFKYKTLKTPTKPWNPSIDRSTMLSIKQAQHADDLKAAPKFFKMRNNTPRFLGNPSDGVKPMFSSQEAPEVVSSPSKHQNKMTLMKVDPQTLSPMLPGGSRSPSKMPPPFTPKRSQNSPVSYPNSMPVVSRVSHSSPPYPLPFPMSGLYPPGFPFPPSEASAASRLLTSMYHPSIPMLFNSLPLQGMPPLDSFQSPPPVQRIPPSSLPPSSKSSHSLLLPHHPPAVASEPPPTSKPSEAPKPSLRSTPPPPRPPTPLPLSNTQSPAAVHSQPAPPDPEVSSTDPLAQPNPALSPQRKTQTSLPSTPKPMSPSKSSPSKADCPAPVDTTPKSTPTEVQPPTCSSPEKPETTSLPEPSLPEDCADVTINNNIAKEMPVQVSEALTT